MKKLRANTPPSNNRLRATVLLVVAISISLTLLHAVGFLRPIEIVADQVFLPVRRAISGVGTGISNQFATLASLGSLGSKNAQLEDEVRDLKRQLTAMREVSRENELLRGQLGFNSRQTLQLVPARVAGYAPDNVREFLTIDVGRSSGVEVGMAVVSNGALVGMIDNVSDYSSRVFLASDVDFRIRALGQDNRANGIVSGQIGTGYSMDKIIQGETIKKGESVVTAGSGLVPKGLLIGTVESIDSSDNAVFQLANLRPAINLNKLELVFVVKGQK